MAKLYPAIRPYRTGFLKVTDGHELYYELCGNPRGKNVLYLHGGPGGGISQKARRFFNPKVYNIILFDQRGAGKSRPFASIKSNTTQKLVEDMRALLKHLGIRKVFLFGGSWGSTLALVYAIKYPKTVTGMLLRGIVLCNSEDNRYYFGGGTANFFPEAWERFASFVPKKRRKDILGFYAAKMKSKNKKVAEKYAREFTRFELSMVYLKTTEKDVEKDLKPDLYKAMGPIEAHYLKNLCFLPDNYIMKNAKKLRMPVVIVHGRYDAICRPLVAYKLHKAIPGSKLHFVISGHASGDKNMQERLVEEMDKFAKRL